MATPTITTAGSGNGLLLITDKEGVISRVPLANVCEIANSSNTDVYRLEICHARGVIILLYSNATEVTDALATIDALY